MATLFTKIIKGEIPGQIIFEDSECAVIADIQKQAPQHFLVIPKKELRSVAHASEQDKVLMGHLLLTAAKVARDLGIAETGYRLVINTGMDGGQSVDHLHIHLLGGRPMSWPPG